MNNVTDEEIAKTDEQKRLLDVCEQLFINAKYDENQFAIMIRSKVAWTAFTNMLKYHKRV